MRTLELMGEVRYYFTDGEKKTFSRMDDFGVPISNLKQIIDMKASDRAEQPGIPTDSTDNQLKDWIYNARLANIEVNDKELQVAIKGERRISSILQVMDMLQDQKINSFSLVTGLRGKDFNKKKRH
jgi:hypothetical protein